MHVHHLFSSVSRESIQERDLPSKELDDFHSSEKLLQQAGAFICPLHTFSPHCEQVLHDPRLNGRQNEEDCKARKRRRSELQNQKHKTDNELDRTRPGLKLDVSQT